MLMLSLFLACTADVETPDAETVVETIIETETVTETVTETEEMCATLAGRQVCDFSMIDENGDEVWLYDLMGKPVILDLSAMWCGPCQRAAEEVQEVQDAHSELTYLTILIENLQSNPPAWSDLQVWENELGIDSAPTWGGSRELISSDPTEIESQLFLSGWPTFYFLDSELRVVGYQRGFDSDIIEGWAESLTE